MVPYDKPEESLVRSHTHSTDSIVFADEIVLTQDLITRWVKNVPLTK